MSTPAEIAAAHDKLIAALYFYAEPGTYHACAFFFDPPTGGFDGDFDEDVDNELFGNGYQRPMPGKLAREALAGWVKIVNPEEPQ